MHVRSRRKQRQRQTQLTVIEEDPEAVKSQKSTHEGEIKVLRKDINATKDTQMKMDMYIKRNNIVTLELTERENEV